MSVRRGGGGGNLMAEVESNLCSHCGRLDPFDSLFLREKLGRISTLIPFCRKVFSEKEGRMISCIKTKVCASPWGLGKVYIHAK